MTENAKSAEPGPKPKPKPTAAVVTWNGNDDASKEAAVRAFARAIQEAPQPSQLKPRPKPKAAVASNVFHNVSSPNLSARDGFDRRDYEQFRDGEEQPRSPKECMAFGMRAYNTVGIVRNVFDLMTDFAAKGIGVEHQSEEADGFYKEWWRRVRGYERSCAFLKQLFLNNTVIARRHSGRLTESTRKDWKRSQGADENLPGAPKVRKGVIPIRYSFLNPLHVDLENEELSTFIGPEALRYKLRLPAGLLQKVKNPRTEEDRRLISLLPEDVRGYLEKSGNNDLPLNPEKISVHHYKKDDWDPWGMPFISAIYADLNMLQKMKLADLSALDGAISSIRVWKLGSIEHGIYPPPEVIQQLSEMLVNNVAGGMMDLVWGPDIDLLETATEVYKFLGETKYAPVLNAIFQGLGIPATLNGTGQRPGTGYTNNYMSLQTFIERLQYGREILSEFWRNELRLVQQGMRHNHPASLYFDSVLTDEAEIMRLYLDLADRNIVSDETIQEMLNLKPDIERIRLRKEFRARKSRRKPVKAGPFHDANGETGLWKILAQTGAYTPEELGLEVFVDTTNAEPPAERAAKITKKYTPKPAPGVTGTPGTPNAPGDAKPKGQPGEGRPSGKKDSTRRARKKVKPRTGRPSSAKLMLGVNQSFAQLEKIAEIVTPLYLQGIKKKNLRELTNEEAENFELFKFVTLTQFSHADKITPSAIEQCCRDTLPIDPNVAALYQQTIARHLEQTSREPTTAERYRYMAGVHALKCIRSEPQQPMEQVDGES